MNATYLMNLGNNMTKRESIIMRAVDRSIQTAFITGGGSGIGLGIARSFLEAGYAVGLFGRSMDRLEQARDHLSFAADRIRIYAGDVRNKGDLFEAVSNFANTWQGLGVVVAAAGMNGRFPAESFPEETFNAIVSTNVNGSLFLAQAAFPHFLKQREGCVIFLVSLMAHTATRYSIGYAASKSAVRHMTEVLALEWAEYGLRVNGISPGYVETAMTASALSNESFRHMVLERTPVHRLIEPEEIGSLAVFLAGPSSRSITGQIIAVDGGFLTGDPRLVVPKRPSNSH